MLRQLVSDPAVRGHALRGLASYADAGTPETILAVYGQLTQAEKRDALATLSSRPAYGKALLDAVAAKKVAISDISADLVRQLRTLRNMDLDQRIAEVWGVVRATAADRLKQQTTYRKMLLSVPETAADVALGRTLYAKTCAQCHTLLGQGPRSVPI